ncbi:MAG: ROK family protein, partial [Chloroflexi bacterium]|nr:ROK family protein [Chloroflexota bacterium]
PQPPPPPPRRVGKGRARIPSHFDWDAPIGCTFPAVVKRGVTLTAANVDNRWIGADAAALLEKRTGNRVLMLNDADAAGIAEMKFGAGKGLGGLVVILTLGTGIGSSLFINGELVPNTEFGHLVIRGKDAEARASDRAREQKDLSWKQWGKRLSEYLQYLEALLTPDLYIIGGGVSKRYKNFFPHIRCDTRFVTAQLRNRAGIIGAAIAAAELI